jgi:hypothetical protein
MTNSALDLIESAISDCESEIGTLDELTSNAAASRETVNKLEAELAEIRSNVGNLEPRVRSSRHVSGQSLLTLERADLAAIESQIDTQADRVVEFARRAIGLLQELWSAVLAVRKTDIAEMLRGTFDLTRIVEPIEMLAAAAYPVIEVTKLDGSLFNYRLRNQRAASIDDARHLRERAAPLIAWAKDLPNLKLNLADPWGKADRETSSSSTNYARSNVRGITNQFNQGESTL